MATFYVDGVNGNDTYTGLEITGTIDSVTSSTIFVDAALTGADDYINNSFFYNETTGHSSLISDFMTSGEIVTLADAEPGVMNVGDTYYILHAFVDLHQFTENSRSAGDIVICRRGPNQMDDGGDLAFTSDGTIDNPIVIEADYANKWRDDVDLSATATATLTFGSKTITFASDISGVLAAGDWIYVASEDAKEFAYEVATVSTVTVTLFLPYKGAQAGSGKTMTNMQDNPIWNTAAGNFNWLFATDNFWKTQGIHLRGSDNNGNTEYNTSGGHLFKDCIFEKNGGGSCLYVSDDGGIFQVFKSRFFNYASAIRAVGSVSEVNSAFIKDCLFDGNTVTSSRGILTQQADVVIVEECEFKGHADGGIGGDMGFNNSNSASSKVFGRNLILSSTPQIDNHILAAFDSAFLEDYNGTIGDNRILNGYSTAEGTPIFQSETSKVRSGGSNKSIKLTPSTDLSTNWEFARIKLFELPIYATTDSKTYTVYFASDTTTEWTASPSATELWIELEYWGHASNNFRRITKSTGTIDMTTDTDFDQTLTVTVAPAQAGVAYLKCYYAKTKESGKANIFYTDPIPEIT